MKNDAPKGMVYKTDGKGNEFLVPDPDRYDSMTGKLMKFRKKVTNYTLPKKKRKRK